MSETKLDQRYRVMRWAGRGGTCESVIARDIETMAEAAEIALRLHRLQDEIGGADEFYAAKD